MLETFIIMWRESVEAFLIVAIAIAYLQTTGRRNLLKSVYAGIAAAVAVSAYAAYALQEFAQSEFTEGVLSLVAGAFVLSLTIYVARNAANIKGDIEKNIDRGAAKTGVAAYIGVFLFTVLMIAREGAEAALLIAIIAEDYTVGAVFAGCALGLLATAAIAFAWLRYSHKINLKRFMQATSIFLGLFATHLMIYGFHELTETQSIPLIDNQWWHMVTETMDGGETGDVILMSAFVGLPLIWMIAGTLQDRKIAAATRAAK